VPKKILIADQSETVREVAENLLRRKGFEVVSASNGVEALELARSAGIDLAFLSSGLPEIDGYTVSKQIKSEESAQSIKVILLLSTSEIVNQHQLLSSLADDTLNKPFSPQDLTEMISAALAVEIEGERDSGTGSAESEIMGDAVEEIDFDKKPDEEIDTDKKSGDEIDFASVFAEERGNGEDQKRDAVFFADEGGTESSHRADLESSDEEVAIDGEARLEFPDEPSKESGDMIRLADDQYGLENPHGDSEIETPHDYHWFVREMKKDIAASESDGVSTTAKGPASSTKTAADKRARSAAGRSTRGENATGRFDVEEIGTSKIPIGVSRYDPDPTNAPRVETEIASDPEIASGELLLAEKLLVKELARKMAEKLVERISSTEFRRIIVEALSSLKKM